MKSLRELVKKNQKAVIALCVLLILGAVYNTFFRSSADTRALTGESKEIISTEVGREIITTLNQLKAISIDTEVLEDPLFRNLFDFSKPLPDQAVGKQNPFVLEVASFVNNNDGGEVIDENNPPTAPVEAPGEIPAQIGNDTVVDDSAPEDAQ